MQHKIPANAASSTNSQTPSETENPAEKYDVKRRDWSSMLIDFDTDAPVKKADDTTVTADQVMESLGLKPVAPGLKNRVGTTSTARKDIKPKSKLEEKQALEDVMGRGEQLGYVVPACLSINLQENMLVDVRPTLVHSLEFRV